MKGGPCEDTGRFNIFYATETNIMHFLEATQFLNAPALAGCKVNVLYGPGLAQRPPPPHSTPGP